MQIETLRQKDIQYVQCVYYAPYIFVLVSQEDTWAAAVKGFLSEKMMAASSMWYLVSIWKGCTMARPERGSDCARQLALGCSSTSHEDIHEDIL